MSVKWMKYLKRFKMYFESLSSGKEYKELALIQLKAGYKNLSN